MVPCNLKWEFPGSLNSYVRVGCVRRERGRVATCFVEACTVARGPTVGFGDLRDPYGLILSPSPY